MMKYAVITGTSVVDTTNSELGASEYAARMHPDATLVPLVTEEDILNDEKYKPGKYITTDVRTARLCEKVMHVNAGYIYGSTTTYDIITICVWTILEFTEVVKQNLIQTAPADTKVTPIITNTHITKTSPITITQHQNQNQTQIQNQHQNQNQTQTQHQNQNQTQTQIQNQPCNKPCKPCKPHIPPCQQKQQINHNIPAPPPITTKITAMPSPTISINTNIKPNPEPQLITQQLIKPQDQQNQQNKQNQNQTQFYPQNQSQGQGQSHGQGQNQGQSQISTIPLSEIIQNPQLLSIGLQQHQHRDKIEMIINHSIAVGTLTEDNIIVAVNDDKLTTLWSSRYPSCFIYENPDDDFIHYLNSQKHQNNMTTKKSEKSHINKLVIFDNCINKDFIDKQQFATYITTAANYGICTIVMTYNSDVICSPLLNNVLPKVMLHSFTTDWTNNISSSFIRRFPVVGDQKNLENYLVQCIRKSMCLVVDRLKPNLISAF